MGGKTNIKIEILKIIVIFAKNDISYINYNIYYNNMCNR